MAVHVRLITPVVANEGHLRALQEQFDLPFVELSQTALDKGPIEIESEIQDALATPYVIKSVIEAEKEGVDAVVIDCMTDPGLKPAREAVSIPVLGAAETSMHLASQLSHKFGWIDPSEHSRPFVEEQALRYGLERKLASFRAVDISPTKIFSDSDATKEALVKASIASVMEDHADMLILGCTDFLGFKEQIEEVLLSKGQNVQVIQPTIVAVLQAAAVALVGLRHSKRSYPKPKNIITQGYEDISFS